MGSTAKKLKKTSEALDALRTNIGTASSRLEQAEAKCRDCAHDLDEYGRASKVESAIRTEMDTLKRRETHLAAQVAELAATDLNERIVAAEKTLAKKKERHLAVRKQTAQSEQAAFTAWQEAKRTGQIDRNISHAEFKQAEAALEALHNERSPKRMPPKPETNFNAGVSIHNDQKPFAIVPASADVPDWNPEETDAESAPAHVHGGA